MAAGVKTSGEFIFQNKNVARYSPVFFKSKKCVSKFCRETTKQNQQFIESKTMDISNSYKIKAV